MDKEKELDNLLKEKLQNQIKPSPEFELKVIRMAEKEKQKVLEEREKNQTQFTKANMQEKIPNKKKEKSHRLNFMFAKVLSMAAAIVIVFTLGMNIKNAPFVAQEQNANLISIKAIKPINLDSGTIANNTEFIIQAEGENLNTEAIQKSIYVDPPLDYTIEKTLNLNEFKLTFKQNIPANTIVKLQYIKNQITEDSWAYQTSNKLSVTRTFPAHITDEVEKTNVIEIELSHANVENFENNVTISPSTKGTWKHIGNIWRFTPKSGLKENQKYTVKINKGIKAGKEQLKDDYIFSFYVGNQEESTNQTSITFDNIVTAKTDELAKITCNNFGEEKTAIKKVEIAKFANIEDFIEYVEFKNYSKATKQGEYEVKQVISNDYDEYLEFKNTLPKGYYVAKVKNTKGRELFDCPIQISDISAYAMETERDVLVWVAKGNELAKNISVKYLDKEIKTDNDGIAKFEGIGDSSEKVKYARINNELVIGIYNFSKGAYPNGYIYTDRPLYKNTDTINIWGFVPRKLFIDKIEDEFYLQLGKEQKQKISVDNNGNFTYKMQLENHINSEDEYLTLYYKDKQIAGKNILIQNYELQNYTYEVITDKKYAKAGETIEFSVKVKHITGLVVPNKSVAITMGENYKDIQKTGEDGIAHFKVKIAEANKESDTLIDYQEIGIYNGDETEYTNAETNLELAVIPRSTYTEIEDSEDEKYKITIHKLDLSKNTNVSWDAKELYNGTYETKVDVRLREETRNRIITGYSYNEYTKQNEPEYTYEEEQDNYTNIKTVTSKNGIVEVNNSEFKIKKNTENTDYFYYIEFLYKDTEGKQVKEFTYYKDNNKNNPGDQEGYYSTNDGVEGEANSDRIHEIGYDNYLDKNYEMYRYFLKKEYKSYNIGEKIEFSLSESTKEKYTEIENKGKLLTIAFKENISDTKVINESKFSHEFTEKDFPSFKITSAYFINGKFYRMPIEYFNFDQEKRKVDVEITPDKEQYKPGDTVNLNIKTTNSGKPVQTNVNISVANEAVFEIQDEELNIIEEIYKNKNYAAYSYSSYLDYILAPAEGGAGGGVDMVRANFADTAHFELISTDKNGNAKVAFKLPDNVTTYRVTAHAVNEDLYLGVNTKKITSKIDFFIQSTEPRGIKTTDDVVLNATAISDTKYDVDYEFTIKETKKKLTAKGKSNNITTGNFGKLPFVTYHAIIKGTHGSQTDSIEYEFKVVESVQEVYKKTTVNIQNSTKIKPSKNPIVLELYSKKMKKYVEYMEFIESTQNERLDTQIAYNKVQELKEKYYGEKSIPNQIQMYLYKDEETYLKNLRSGKKDLVLTALTKYFAKNYMPYLQEEISNDDNVFEYYLIAAAEGKPVLEDLKYLKEEKDITNYSKLMVTLGLEFIGDYSDAKELYTSINLTQEQAQKYKSIVAIIETFINKQNATKIIDELIKNKPADEYLRFAILSYFQNNSIDIGKEETIKVKTSKGEKTVSINGLKVETLTLNNKDLSEITFETDSENIIASYYYKTLLENIEDENIKKDITIKGSGELKKGNTVYININFEGKYEGEVNVALPNGLRLAKNYNIYDENAKYYIQNNNIDCITIYKFKNCKSIKLPLIAINEGKYKFENIVSYVDGVYHISNSIDLKIK